MRVERSGADRDSVISCVPVRSACASVSRSASPTTNVGNGPCSWRTIITSWKPLYSPRRREMTSTSGLNRPRRARATGRPAAPMTPNPADSKTGMNAAMSGALATSRIVGPGDEGEPENIRSTLAMRVRSRVGPLRVAAGSPCVPVQARRAPAEVAATQDFGPRKTVQILGLCATLYGSC